MSLNDRPAATATAKPAGRVPGMKKFSRLFAFTRLSRGRPDTVPEWDLAAESTREASPDLHQLSSRRRRGEGQPKRPARNGLSRLVVDTEHPPCAVCDTIDFPRLLKWRPGEPRPWIPLAHTLAGDSACPYCIFFQALVGAEPDLTRKFTPYLRIRQAFERLGVGEKHELGGAVLFEVTTKSKVLPWGYIVPVIENTDDLAGYREATPAIRGRVITPKLDPALPRTWIDFCMANHSKTTCASPGRPIRGLKLLDCRDMEILFVDDLMAEAVEYVTLSYVRGGSEELPAPNGVLPGVLPTELPPLIADAMAVTQSLGFRYLWVDQYCFPQYNGSERRRQLDRMGDIYARSALTLIVAAGESVSDGIPGVSVPREEQLSLQTEAGHFTTSLTRPDVEVASSRWASRGWTYQEGLLSRRRLVFTPSQTYFQCQHLHCHETISYPLQTQPTLNLGRVFPSAGAGTQAKDFKAQVNGYMSREVTYPEDRLDAFRGVLDRYAHMDPAVDNLLGLPLYHPQDFKNVPSVTRTDRLAMGLGWKHEHVGEADVLAHSMFLHGPFPSWTWLAWKQRPDFPGYGPSFNLYEVCDDGALIDNVTASPNLEISIGFKDLSVLSWEEEGDAIAAKTSSISFLRLKSHCFDIHLNKDTDGTIKVSEDLDLRDPYPSAIAAFLLRAAYNMPDNEPPAGDHELVGIILAGRDWKNDESFESASVLICGRRNWVPDGELVRLGTLELGAGGLLGIDDETAVIKGAMNDDRRLDVQLRELDIY
ncbi:heterokaryon incompatibility protein-domain-containing protein [Ilyonectria robusta]|uniref:heterokaryon incompatibility protein-domain-containing protein n=1 Tax=Ilyonectria robusta TaxID=1079257 RepID=UPI001E8ED28E|nr:heterokaryon incompatibility protein-domain-containing protein [Ilyonectria robusta]KAH8733540.1 heterokaryon incompatibility protein-domain-containing protein [Ilyonectria robusta]